MSGVMLWSGALTVINGIFNCMVIAILPKDVKATSDPYKSYTGGEKVRGMGE